MTDLSSPFLPSHVQVPYASPDFPNLLSLAGYLYLLSFTSSLADSTINAPLLGPLLIGILLGPSLAGLLTPVTQQAFIDLGYIGLILIVFEAGLTTHLPLLFGNAGLSCAAALTGILLPIALSMALLKGAWGYTGLQAFAAGAALCSTSLGTTLALLTPNLRKTRVGSVLMWAALLDDVVGLVIAGIIPGLAQADSGVDWVTIVRPILVSIAFGLGTPLLAWCFRRLLRFDWDRMRKPVREAENGIHFRTANTGPSLLCDSRAQLFIIVLTLSAFLAGTKYAGTSELFGAYLAGAFLTYIFNQSSSCQPTASRDSSITPRHNDSSSPALSALPRDLDITPTPTHSDSEPSNPSLDAFTAYVLPILTPLLGPIFFASIGSALPVSTLFTTFPRAILNGTGVDRGPASHGVVWRGIVYSILMILAKMAVGLWILVWPEPGRGNGIGRLFWRWVSWFKTVITMVWGWCRYFLEDGDAETSEKDLVPTAKSDIKDPSSTSAGAVSAMTLGQLERGVRTSLSVLPSLPSIPAETSSSTGQTPEFQSPPIEHQRQMPQASDTQTQAQNPDEPTRTRAAVLLGLAMVARGEIALIVAQLAWPLLLGAADGATRIGTADEEPFAIVIWAILVSTVGGALGVGMLLGSWRRQDSSQKGLEVNTRVL